MTESKICTCPSGDGSLRWPCPKHPAVEQAGGDERAAFELFVRKHCGMPEHVAVNWDAKFTNDAWEGWQARAAWRNPPSLSMKPASKSGWPTNSRARTASLFRLRYATLPSPAEHSTIGPSWNIQPRSVASASALACRRGW